MGTMGHDAVPLRCPVCGATTISVSARIWVDAATGLQDETATERGLRHDYISAAACRACGRRGIVADFCRSVANPSFPEAVRACIDTGQHLRSCDDDGYCNACGHQDGAGDDEPLFTTRAQVPPLLQIPDLTDRSLLSELLEAYVDACTQGAGEAPFSSPTWHQFLSAYEDAEVLILKVQRALRLASVPGVDGAQGIRDGARCEHSPAPGDEQLEGAMCEGTPSEGSAPWHEAGVEADYRWHQFGEARTPLSQAEALVSLSNAMHDLRTFLPGYEFETGTLPWERELD